MLSDEEYQDIKDKLGESAEEYVDHFSSRLNQKHYRCSDHHSVILDWWAGDRDNWVSKHHMSEAKQSPRPGESGNSFDTDDFFGAALKRSFGDDFELHSK